MDDERARLIREVKQRLQALRRAGLDRLPQPNVQVEPRSRSSPKPGDPESGADVGSPTASLAPTTPVGPSSLFETVTPSGLFSDPELEGTAIPADQKPAALAALAAEVAACTRCPILASSRTQTVFGEGSPTARLMFVGEAPGADEDRTGRPFVGRAGMLLTDMITKGMGLAREEVYIANILKSRPPENRQPLPDEIAHCRPFLERQIEIIRPEFLCLLGRTAALALLETSLSLAALRRKWHRYQGIPTLVTYHPAYLLRNPASKKDTWEDLQMLMQAMGITPPARKNA
jgi:uracil-DNA glycosylase